MCHSLLIGEVRYDIYAEQYIVFVHYQCLNTQIVLLYEVRTKEILNSKY